MKRNDNYIVRTIAGETLLVPTGPAARDFSGLITLNEMGAFLWNNLNTAQNLDGLVARVLEEYEVDEATARQDVQEFLDLLVSRNMAQL